MKQTIFPSEHNVWYQLLHGRIVFDFMPMAKLQSRRIEESQQELGAELDAGEGPKRGQRFGRNDEHLFVQGVTSDCFD